MADSSLTTVLASAGGDAAVSFVKKILGPAGDELSGMVADYIRIHRLGNQIRMFRRSERMLTEAGFKPNPVALKVLWPLMEGASLEEEEALATKWASLLANAATPQGNSLVEPSFADVLRQLTPLQAQILDKIYEKIDGVRLKNELYGQQPVNLYHIRAELAVEFALFERCMDNLIRLHLCTKELPNQRKTWPGGGFRGTSIVDPTLFGYDFVMACTPPQAIKAV